MTLEETPIPNAPTPTPRIALTIAGTDSGAGAGVAADLRTFAASGVFGTLVVTAVTAQNTLGLRQFLAMSPELVAAQLDAVLEDMDVRAAKTGMLATRGVVELLASRAAAGGLPPLVVDPVLVSSSGKPIFGDDDITGAYRALFASASVITPNLPEASLLTGLEVTDLSSMEAAARRLQGLGPSLVIVKGGRRRDTEALDVAFDGHAVTLLRGPVGRHGERARQRVHLLGRHRRQPGTWPRASRGGHFCQAVRHKSDTGQLELASRSWPRASRPDGGGLGTAHNLLNGLCPVLEPKPCPTALRGAAGRRRGGVPPAP